MSKVLVVDDDIDILTLVKTILTMNSYTVETIYQWEKINSMIESFKPELILLDISLQGADGMEICKELKQDDKTKNIPVVLFSANVEMAKRASECNAEAYLSKPFTINDLIGAIKNNI